MPEELSTASALILEWQQVWERRLERLGQYLSGLLGTPHSARSSSAPSTKTPKPRKPGGKS